MTTGVNHQAVATSQRQEGEPRTRARVEGMAQERWPRRTATSWITRESPRRHVSVRFGRDTIEGSADTWLDAFDAVDDERLRRGIRL